jgi:DNA-binding XRE family transcriptional regulator
MISESESEVTKMYEKLKQIREEKGYTLADLARVIDKSIPNYSMKENGKLKFSVSEALKIADFLEEKVEDIFLKTNLQ